MIMNIRKSQIAQHFNNAHEYDYHAHIQKKICHELMAKIQQDSYCYPSILEIGAGSGYMTQLLNQALTAKRWVINDLCPAHQPKLSRIIPQANIIIDDAENSTKIWQSHAPYDLIISANAIQWFDNPLSFINKANHALNQQGQLLFNTFTPQHFIQIKHLTGQGLQYPTQQQWQQRLTECHFQILNISTKKYDVHFQTPYEVLKHIKQTGVSTNTTQKPFLWNKHSLKQFEQQYWQLYSDDQQTVILTYEALFIHAIKQTPSTP